LEGENTGLLTRDVDEIDDVLDTVEDIDVLPRDDVCVSVTDLPAALSLSLSFSLAAAAVAAVAVTALGVVAVAASSASTSSIIMRVVVGDSVTLRAGTLHGPSTLAVPYKGDSAYGENLPSTASDIIGDGFSLLLADADITGVREAESEEEEEEEEVEEGVDNGEREDTDEKQGETEGEVAVTFNTGVFALPGDGSRFSLSVPFFNISKLRSKLLFFASSAHGEIDFEFELFISPRLFGEYIGFNNLSGGVFCVLITCRSSKCTKYLHVAYDLLNH
jgi:hypothetical protein